MKIKSLAINLLSLIIIVGAGLTYYIINNSEVRYQIKDSLIQNQNLINNKIKKVSKPKEVSVIFVGDIMLSRMVDQKMRDYDNYNYPFLKVSDYLKSADVVFGNLETAITPGRNIQTGEMVFRSDPQVAEVLSENNFKILSLANNHTPNFGQQGLQDTFKYLTESDIKYTGAGKDDTEAYAPVYYEEKGLKFGFLGYTYSQSIPTSYQASSGHAGVAFMDVEKMIEGVTLAKENSDIVIVSMHAGDEYTSEPNESQKDFAYQAIDAGADLVIGHHPHWVQSTEIYKDKYIFYSLGNFVFDQMWSQKTREGLALKIIFTKDGVTDIKSQEIIIEDYAQPNLINIEEGDEVASRQED